MFSNRGRASIAPSTLLLVVLLVHLCPLSLSPSLTPLPSLRWPRTPRGHLARRTDDGKAGDVTAGEMEGHVREAEKLQATQEGVSAVSEEEGSLPDFFDLH